MSDTPVIRPISPKATPSEVRQAFSVLRVWFARMQKQGGIASEDSVRSVVAASGTAATPGAYPTPDAPTGLTATGAFNTIILEWDNPTYEGHSYTEIWRATADVLGSAVLVGQAPGDLFADTPSDTSLSVTYYYWIRHVNLDGLAGAYNATAGTSASTADDPEYVLELLQDSKWKASTAYTLDALTYPLRPNGYAYKCTVAGTSGTSEPTWPTTVGNTVSDGTVTWRCEADLLLEAPFMLGLVGGVVKMVLRDVLIGDASITSAKILSLAADKIVAASLSAISANMGTLTSGVIELVTGLAKLRLEASRLQGFDTSGVSMLDLNAASNYFRMGRSGDKEIIWNNGTLTLPTACISTANIVDANVSKLKLAGDTVTVMAVDELATYYDTGSNSTWNNSPLELTIDMSGGAFPVVVQCDVLGYAPGTTGSVLKYRVIRDGTTVVSPEKPLQDFDVYFDEIAQNNYTEYSPIWQSVLIMDTPSAASHTYTVQFWRTVAGHGLDAQSTMTLVGAKNNG